MSIGTRIGLACAAVMVSAAAADVQGYGIGYQYNYTQPNAIAVDLLACSCYWSTAANPGDIGTATTSVLATRRTYPSVEVVPGVFQGGVPFTDPAAMMAEFPLDTFRLRVTGGAAGSQSGDVTPPTPLNLPDQAPRFNALQFPGYQSIDSSRDFTFRFNTFDSTGQDEIVYFVVDAYPSTARVFFAQTTPDAGQVRVPAGSLRLNRRFYATIYFVSVVRTAEHGFGSITPAVTTQRSTRIQIRTAGSCPADYNGDNFLDFFDYDDFVGDFESGNPDADYNGDDFVDFFDYNDFVAAFESGC